MNLLNKFLYLLPLCTLIGCMTYHSPNRNTWPQYLSGVSFTDMTDTAKQAKIPVYMGKGGKIITSDGVLSPNMQYGDKNNNDNYALINYMANLEYKLYDSIRKPGFSVQRAGTDVIIVLVRDAIMETNIADISPEGNDTLNIISNILKEYDATFIEIAGYTDSMKDSHATYALSLDMAQRVGVYFSQKNISTSRMFIVGRGASRPIASQDDIGRLTNRRIEIRISPAR